MWILRSRCSRATTRQVEALDDFGWRSKVKRHKRVVLVDYGVWQIVVPDIPGWPSSFGSARVIRSDDGLAILTASSFVFLPLEVEVGRDRPETIEDEWLHVVDVSLPSMSELAIVSWEDEPLDPIPIPFDGPLRLRFSWKNIHTDEFAPVLRFDDDKVTSTEEMRLQVWPEEEQAPDVPRWHPALASIRD